MAWTYSGDPANSDRDWVRFKIQDTDTNDQQLADAEIDAMLSEHSSRTMAAAVCAEALAAKYTAKATDKTLGALSIKWGDRAASYRKLAKQLRQDRVLTGQATPHLGARSIASKDAALDDTDRVQPAFTRDQDGPVPEEHLYGDVD